MHSSTALRLACRTSFRPRFLVAALAFFFTSVFVQAQEGVGAIQGTVTNESSGNYLEGAEVRVEGTDLQAYTGRGGGFVIPNVPVGSHRLVITYPGLTTGNQSVAVNAGETADARVALRSELILMEQVTVQGAREGMSQATALQKASIQFKVVAAADQFGEISEGNVGEYLKFLPGVSIDYNVNDARGVSLRGLSTAFTIVAVDGTPMAGASSTDDTRRFEFEQIAMNNVETTELFKTVTPDIPASATGGYVNFVTKSAFDHTDVQRISYNLSFSAPSSNVSLSKKGGVWGTDREYTIRPNLELNASRKITDKLGLNLNYRLSEKYDDSPRHEITWVTAATAPTVMTAPRLQQFNIRHESKLTHREAFALKLDYRLSPDTSLMFSGQWNWYDLLFTQRGPQFILGTASTASNGVFTSGATGASIQNGVLQRNKYGTTIHFNAGLQHRFGNGSKLRLTPYVSRADGKYRDGDKGYISSAATLSPGASTFSSFSFANIGPFAEGNNPTVTLASGATSVPLDFVRDLGNYTLSNTTGTNFQSRPWTAIDEKQGVNGAYSMDLPIRTVPVTLEAGFAFDDVSRYINRPDYRWNIPATTGAALEALADPDYDRDVAFGFGRMEVLDPSKVWAALRGNPVTLNALDRRDISEQNTAGYLRADVKVRRDLVVTGGVRWEKREIDANAVTGSPARARAALAQLEYDEWYPSITARYAPTRRWVIRAGASRTVGHPDYGEILPTFVTPTTSTATDGSISIPDSDLKPYFSTNYDVAVDFYPNKSGVIGVSVFRKDVSDYITPRIMSTTERDLAIQDYGLDPADFGVTVGTTRVNGSESVLQGFELSYVQNFTFLPRPFNGLSLQANFSYVDVDAEDPDRFRALDTLYSQLRAVSPKTANLVLGYKIGRLSTTVTTNWVDEALYGGFVNTNYVTGSANTANTALDTRLALYKDEKTTTDVKLEYAFSRRIAAYFLVRNIFNTPRAEFYRGYLPEYQNVVLPLRYFEFGEPHYTLGIRGTF